MSESKIVRAANHKYPVEHKSGMDGMCHGVCGHYWKSIHGNKITPIEDMMDEACPICARLAKKDQRIDKLKGGLQAVVEVGLGVPFDTNSVNLLLDKVMECKEISETALMGQCECGSNDIFCTGGGGFQEAAPDLGRPEIDAQEVACSDCGRSWYE